MEQCEQRFKEMEQRFDGMRAGRDLPPPLDAMPRPKMMPHATPDELLEFDKARPIDLTECAQMIPRLAGNSPVDYEKNLDV